MIDGHARRSDDEDFLVLLALAVIRRCRGGKVGSWWHVGVPGDGEMIRGLLRYTRGIAHECGHCFAAGLGDANERLGAGDICCPLVVDFDDEVAFAGGEIARVELGARVESLVRNIEGYLGGDGELRCYLSVPRREVADDDAAGNLALDAGVLGVVDGDGDRLFLLSCSEVEAVRAEREEL